MKITAGLGCIDDYERLVKAGADEVFCGFVPYEWNKTYGTIFPLNRREVLYYNVQINSYEDMKILKRMEKKYNVPVTIAFNYLYYIEEQYKVIEEIMRKLIKIGFKDFIIADLALLIYLKDKNLECSIHLSGECAELNSLSIEFFNKFKISRYIFHRKNTIDDMKSCIGRYKGIEYEAFVLNEKCHYTGAFCSSFHCDELIHMCKVPYELGRINKKSKTLECLSTDNNFELEQEEAYNFGNTGCGICALRRLNDAGVTHLKVVGRGNYIELMERDVAILRKALDILETTKDEKEFVTKIKSQVLTKKCINNCYYNQ